MEDDGKPAAAAVSASRLVPPRSLQVSFVLWLVIGIPGTVLVVGTPVLLAALHLRAGSRGARLLLTAVGLLSVGYIATAVAALDPAPLVFVPVPLVAVVATTLMWLPEADGYMAAVRASRPA